MIKFSQKQLKQMIALEIAEDISDANIYKLKKTDPLMEKLGYSIGTNGRNGLLLKGCTTKKLYVIKGRTTALDMF